MHLFVLMELSEGCRVLMEKYKKGHCVFVELTKVFDRRAKRGTVSLYEEVWSGCV